MSVLPHITQHVSAVDNLRQQIVALKAKTAQEEAKPGTSESPGQQGDHAKEIGRLEETLNALQKLEASYRCSRD